MQVRNAISVAALTLLLSACGSDNDDDSVTAPPPPPPPPVEQAQLRVIHASADAPAVNILVNGAVVEGLAGVDYRVGSGFLALDEATYSVAVDGILPDTSTVQVLDLGDLALEGNTEYTVVAHGVVAADDDSSNDLAAAIISNPETELGAGNIRLQVLHAAPNAPTVDLHVTGAEDELGSALATLAYGDVTGQVEVPAGVYRVRLVLPEGSDGAGAVAFDVVLPDLAAGADLFVTAVPKTGVMASPVKLLVNDGVSTSSFIDDRTTAEVRVIHTAADVPNVDIFVDDGKVDALSNAPFNGVTGYVALPEGEYTVDARLTDDNTVTGISASLSVLNNTKYTVHAVGTLAADDDAALEYYVLEDTVRAVATETKIRLTHAHPSVGNVDIYVTADGNIADVEPAFADVPYKANTGFVVLSPGDYQIQVTATGTKTVAIDTGIITLAAGGVYSATAVNAPEQPIANLVLSDDFVE